MCIKTTQNHRSKNSVNIYKPHKINKELEEKNNRKYVVCF